MDWLEFIQKSEWPLVVGGSLILFRKPISELLRGLRPIKLKAFGVDAEFETRLQKAEELTASVPAGSEAALPSAHPGAPPMAFDEASSDTVPKGSGVAAQPQPTSEPPPTPSLIMFHTTPPAVRVLRAYSGLDVSLRSLARSTDDKDKPRPTMRDVSALGASIGFDADEIAALQELRKIRDRAAHGSDVMISSDEATRFEMVAARLGNRAMALYQAGIRKRLNEEASSLSPQDQS